MLPDEAVEAAARAISGALGGFPDAPPTDFMLKAARAALAALSPWIGEVEGWRPIESAPKDGTDVLVAEGGSVYCASWAAGTRYTGWSAGNDDSFPEFDYANPCSPTHWRPLPDPPAAPRLPEP